MVFSVFDLKRVSGGAVDRRRLVRKLLINRVINLIIKRLIKRV